MESTPTFLPTLELEITGMDCASCAQTLERGVARLDGVQRCEVNFATGKMHISGNVDADALEARIASLGYGVASPAPAPASTHSAAGKDTPRPRGLPGYLLARRETTLALIGLALLLASAPISLWGPASLAPLCPCSIWRPCCWPGLRSWRAAGAA